MGLLGPIPAPYLLGCTRNLLLRLNGFEPLHCLVRENDGVTGPRDFVDRVLQQIEFGFFELDLTRLLTRERELGQHRLVLNWLCNGFELLEDSTCNSPGLRRETFWIHKHGAVENIPTIDPFFT